MIKSILQFSDLQEICKPGKKPRLRTVESWAAKIGLRYTYDAEGGIVSTVEALNLALGIDKSAANDEEAYRAEDML